MENQKQEQKLHKRHYWTVKAGKTGRENKEVEQETNLVQLGWINKVHNKAGELAWGHITKVQITLQRLTSFCKKNEEAWKVAKQGRNRIIRNGALIQQQNIRWFAQLRSEMEGYCKSPS